MVSLYIKKHLSIIWVPIYKKYQGKGGLVEKKCCLNVFSLFTAAACPL